VATASTAESLFAASDCSSPPTPLFFFPFFFPFLLPFLLPFEFLVILLLLAAIVVVGVVVPDAAAKMKLAGDAITALLSRRLLLSVDVLCVCV